MTTLTFIDAATLPAVLPPGDGFAFYIGGDTPHIWTAAEVAVLKAHYRFLLPVFVRSDPPGPGAQADVAAAQAQLKTIGAPPGILIAWDSETSVDAGYIAQVYGLLAAAGDKLIDYGSQNYVTANKVPGGWYWGADWTSRPHLTGTDEMTQWASGAYDTSLAQATLPFWDTRPGDATPAPRKPPPPPGQWDNPAAWTWKTAVTGGLGEDGASHMFVFTGTGWNKIA
jgi:hypothetical protein